MEDEGFLGREIGFGFGELADDGHGGLRDTITDHIARARNQVGDVWPESVSVSGGVIKLAACNNGVKCG